MSPYLAKEQALGNPDCFHDLPAGIVALPAARKLTLAIDFDGVLSLADWPAVGDMPLCAAMVMRLLEADGHQLIINTCRTGAALDAALDFLGRWDVPYHFVNENTPERIALYGSDSRKISADLYFDDKSACMRQGGVDWMEFLFEVNRLAATTC